mmetsp:Transcript_3569/g.8388  ORF Transcript_3569/g.8388 Transcript_3569/m.8388 type:complete len:210 (-) Transcript_3569:1241-1870(-)
MVWSRVDLLGRCRLHVSCAGINVSSKSNSICSSLSQQAGSCWSSPGRVDSLAISPKMKSDRLQACGIEQSLHTSSIGSRYAAACRYRSLHVLVAPTVRQFLQVAGLATVPCLSWSPVSPAAVTTRKSCFSCMNLSISIACVVYSLQFDGRSPSLTLQPHASRWMRAPASYGPVKRFSARSLGTLTSLTRLHTAPGMLQFGSAFCMTSVK